MNYLLHYGLPQRHKGQTPRHKSLKEMIKKDRKGALIIFPKSGGQFISRRVWQHIMV